MQPNPTKNRLLIEHFRKAYKGKEVVKDVSFSVNSAEIVGLLGPNGAGKTTCFYLTLGMIQLDGGKIFLNNQDISRLKLHDRARLGIGYLPQEPSIFRKLTVNENILAILELRPDLTPQARKQQRDALLEEFRIQHLRDHLGISLSGGERRRVEVARALAMKPKFILLDEPFAGVDPISVIEIKHIIHQLRDRQVGILITDHNVRETLDICHRAYIINGGVIITEGTPQAILANQDVREVYLGENFSLQ